MYRVGIDIGGTFTDMLLVGEDGGAVIGKTLTTPGDPSLAVEDTLRPVLENGTVKPGDRGTLIHGTTLVTNALIERKGAPTALLTTAGFRDAVEIGREHRYELYDLNLDYPNRWSRAICASTFRSESPPMAPCSNRWTRILSGGL